MRASGFIVLLVWPCLLAAAGCRETPQPQVVKLGTTANVWNACVGHASQQCGPEKDDMRRLLKTAAASEPACHGVDFQPLKNEEMNIPTPEIPNYLMVLFESPGHWRYYLNVNGESLGETEVSEGELVRRVCIIVKGAGGSISH
jgi:hypothetical protein